MMAIGTMESASLMAKFNLSNVKLHLPYHVAFSIDVVHGEKTIVLNIIDKCASTCLMSISCWKYLGSPELVPSKTLLSYFDRYLFPHGIVSSFKIKNAWKVVSIEIEVVDSPLDYNLILGRILPM